MITMLRISAILITLGTAALTGCVADIDDTPGEPEATDDRSASDSTEEIIATAEQAITDKQVVRLRAAHSLKCVDVAGASTGNNASIIQWDCNGQPNQQFQMRLQPDGSWELSAMHSGKCLTVYWASTANGAPLVQYDCNHGSNQQFWVHYATGSYFLQAKNSGKYMEVKGYSLDNGAVIDQWDYNGGLLNQRFYIE